MAQVFAGAAAGHNKNKKKNRQNNRVDSRDNRNDYRDDRNNLDNERNSRVRENDKYEDDKFDDKNRAHDDHKSTAKVKVAVGAGAAESLVAGVATSKNKNITLKIMI